MGAAPERVLDGPLSAADVAAVAAGAPLRLGARARARILAARALVEAIVAKGVRAYGVNTGVGALCQTVVDTAHQRELSRALLFSTAAGVGAPLGREETRAIIACAVNNWAHGHSGVRIELAEYLLAFLDADCLPEVPSGGSVGYLTHMAHIALVLIGEGHAWHRGERLGGAAALARLGLPPLVLEAKEGLSLINGTPCATGIAAVATARAARLLDWADAIGALTFENLHGQMAAFAPETLAYQVSPGLNAVGARLRAYLAGSGILAASIGTRVQDALSLRAMPHAHGAARDALVGIVATIDRELASVTDNPAVDGTPEHPIARSEAHAVSVALALAMDGLANAVGVVAAMSERRIDRLVNPLVSGLPPFLATDVGVCSGFMIAQYTAAGLAAENRRLASPASLDGGVTSGLQEDYLSHATPAALKALAVVTNAARILGIELVASAQAADLQPAGLTRAPGTDAVYRLVRRHVPLYADDRPLADDMQRAAELLGAPVPFPG